MDLQVYGMRNVMEQATTHIAVDTMSGGKAAVHHGNVAHLVGADAAMNSASTIDTPEARAISAEAALPLADVATNYDTQFLRHIIRASKLVKEKPQLGCEWLAKATGFERGMIDRSFHQHDYCAIIAPDQLEVMVDQDKWIAQEQGRAPRSREALATLLDYSVYHEAVAGR